MSDENKNKDGIEFGESQDFYDPTKAGEMDAGFSDEFEDAAEEASGAVISFEHRRKAADEAMREIYQETNLVKRVKKLVANNAIDFVHFDSSKDLPGVQKVRRSSLMNRHAIYDALFDKGSGVVPYPHFDTFKGRLVDHHGNVIGKTLDDVREMLMVVNAAGMENPTEKEVVDSIKSWAATHKRDSLKYHISCKMPEWDGTERIEQGLITLFKPKDTNLNRLISKYFWLSLYNRMMQPGILAPVTISLIGGQNAGKSYFATLLCRHLMGDSDVDAVELDLGVKNYNHFLRDITGRSIIANVGEMTGFNKGDVNRIKSFISRTTDDLDFKFEDTITKKRQWITIMDGNDYEGLQRDETGNRRFYPLFVGQLEDKGGQPHWDIKFEVDFQWLEDNIWHMMAECKSWMDEKGEKGWVSFVRVVSNEVRDFSASEMKLSRGTIKDDLVEAYLRAVIVQLEFSEITPRSKDDHRSAFIPTSTIIRGFSNLAKRTPYSKSLRNPMSSLGFEQGQRANVKGYKIPMVDGEVINSDEFLMRILNGGNPDFDVEEMKWLLESCRGLSDNEGNF